MEDPKDYASAFAELKEILSALQQDEIGVDALAEGVLPAGECAEVIRKTTWYGR